MPDLLREFSAVVEALARAGVPFPVCGGLAMAIHARPRATIDIDLLAPAEHVGAVTAVAEGLGFERRLRDPIRLAGGTIVMHPLTKISPGEPDVLTLDVIEAGAGAAGMAWACSDLPGPGDRSTWCGRPCRRCRRSGSRAMRSSRRSARPPGPPAGYCGSRTGRRGTAV